MIWFSFKQVSKSVTGDTLRAWLRLDGRIKFIFYSVIFHFMQDERSYIYTTQAYPCIIDAYLGIP